MNYKKIVMSLIFSFVMTALQAQIGEAIRQPEKIKIGESGHHSLSYYISEGDTVFHLLFRNQRYTSIYDYKSISFEGGFEDLDVLYDAIMSVFQPENRRNKEYSVLLPVGNDEVRISVNTMMGFTGALIQADDGYFGLSEKMTRRLFGKQND